MNFSTDPKMLIGGLAITALAVLVAHLLDRLAGSPQTAIATLLRYAAGCVAIGAGLAMVLDPEDLALVVAFTLVAGFVTAVCHLWRESTRAQAAESAIDEQTTQP